MPARVKAQDSKTAPVKRDQSDSVSGRLPPHNLDAESGLLGSCVLDGTGDLINLCLESRMKPEAFYLPAHQIIFQVLIDLFQDAKPVDEVILMDRLAGSTIASIPWLKERHRMTPEDTSLIDLVGGPGFLADLTSRIQSTAHAHHWLEIVREKWLLRRLIKTTVRIADDAHVQQDRLDNFIDAVEKEILSINEDWVSDSAQKFSTPVEASLKLINQMIEGKSEDGVLSGFIDLDNMTFGFHRGQMVVIAARPSMGKTSFAMNVAEHVALPGSKKSSPNGVLIFSLEMPADQLAMRMLCGRARVNLARIRDRMISKEDMRKLSQTGTEMQGAPIWVDDSSGLNILELRAKARRICQRENIGVIVIDYLQLISGTDQRVPREQQISEISRGVKAMSKELNLPILILSQLNRSSEKENRVPRISDLRESGSIEQDADVVLLLAPRSESEDKTDQPVQAQRERKLIVAKQRNGPTGSIDLTFIPEYTRFENYIRTPSE